MNAKATEATTNAKSISYKYIFFLLAPLPLPIPWLSFTFSPSQPQFGHLLLPWRVIAFETLHYTPGTPCPGTSVHLCLLWLMKGERTKESTPRMRKRRQKKGTARARIKRRARMKRATSKDKRKE